MDGTRDYFPDPDLTIWMLMDQTASPVWAAYYEALLGSFGFDIYDLSRPGRCNSLVHLGVLNGMLSALLKGDQHHSLFGCFSGWGGRGQLLLLARDGYDLTVQRAGTGTINAQCVRICWLIDRLHKACTWLLQLMC
jgi:hypothetical protein